MALKQCEECGKDISSKANQCPHCGVPLKRTSSSSNGCLLVLLFVFILFMGNYIVGLFDTNTSKTPPPPPPSPKVKEELNDDRLELTPGQLDLILNLQNKQLISIEPIINTVHIDPGLWHSMKVDLKEDLAATLSIYCGNKKGTYLYWVEIYDQYSGKKLAKFSRAWGFKIFK